MKPRLLSLLRCPKCKSDLHLQILRDHQKEILDGFITCVTCGAWFPVIDGVPRMLHASLQRDLILIPHVQFLTSYEKHLPSHVVNEWRAATRNTSHQADLKVRTARSFGYEWNTFLSKTLQEKNEVYRRDFLEWINPVKQKFFKDRVVLEAGSGVGRHTYLAAQFDPKEIVSIDLSEAVRASYENTKHFPNTHVVQADIYHLPFSKDLFDYVFSIGVLHHLPDPEQGFRSLIPLLKPGGTVSIWVYGRKHNSFHVYFNETIRRVTRKIPFKLLHTLCYLPALGIAGSNLCYKMFKSLRITQPLARLMPFKIYADLPFIVKLNDAFDVFATPRSTYWKKEEIEGWFVRAGFITYAIKYLRKKSLIGYGIRNTP